MIVVNVHLDSAISPTRDTELARVLIANVGCSLDGEKADYKCVSLRGRSKTQLDKQTVNRKGNIKGHSRKRDHVLNLVAKALISMGYGK